MIPHRGVISIRRRWATRTDWIGQRRPCGHWRKHPQRDEQENKAEKSVHGILSPSVSGNRVLKAPVPARGSQRTVRGGPPGTD